MSEIQLPEGWVWQKLGEVCKTTSGGTPSRTNSDFYKGSIPWVKSGELKNGVIYDTEEHISEEAIKSSSAKVFPTGTLLIALYGATVGRLAFLGIEAATNQAVCGITPTRSLERDYLYWLLFFKRPQLLEERAGGAQPNISQSILREISLPLPPVPVQRAIVARIEELFSELDAGVQELRTALTRLMTYRQAVLHHYLNNPDWERVKLGDVANIVVGYVGPIAEHLTADKDGVPLLSTTHIGVNRFINHDVRLVTHKFALSNRKSLVEPGHIIIARHGDSGKACMVPDKYPIYQVSNAVIARTKSDIVLNTFVCYFLNYQREVMQENRVGAVFQVVNTKTMSSFPVPLPDLTIQNQTVLEIEARLSEADGVETTIRQELARAENLRQSILKQAFSGNLVTAPINVTEPADAEELEQTKTMPVSNYGGKADQLTLF